MKRTLMVFAFCWLMTASLLAQHSDISLNGFGTYNNDLSGHGLRERITHSGGGVFSYRFFPGEHKALEVNLGYSKNQHYLSLPDGTSVTHVQTNVYEFTAAYVYQVKRGAWQPFFLFGGGLTRYSPTSDTSRVVVGPAANTTTKPTLLYSVGSDYTLRKNLSLRAQFRGLLSAAPDFYGKEYKMHTSAAMMTLEPSLGVAYRF